MADFNFVIPLQKDLNGNSLTGIASTVSVDRDDERMSSESLKMMVMDIKTAGVNLFGNHEHNWENTLGYIKDAELVDNKVQIKIDLDDPTTNPKIPMLLNKLKRGINLGLSVGGNVLSYKWDYDKTSNKKVKVLDRVKIYEVSVVGIPANPDSYLAIPSAIAKSIKKSNKTDTPCPSCGTMMTRINDKHLNCPKCDYDLISVGPKTSMPFLREKAEKGTGSTNIDTIAEEKYGKPYDKLNTPEKYEVQLESTMRSKKSTEKSKCDHVWDDEVGYGLHCVLCGKKPTAEEKANIKFKDEKSCPLCYSKEIKKGACSQCLTKI